jgi:SsrA-binding protein
VKEKPVRDLAQNRRARHDYEILDTFEAGLSLLGSEVKSVRDGRANLAEAFVRLSPGGAWLLQCHISAYEQANRNNHEPTRQRRLLLHQTELIKLKKATGERGLTIVPLRLYLRGPWIKVEIAVVRGKKLHDKREAIKKRDAEREVRARR